MTKKTLLVTVADKNSISKAKALFTSAHLNGCWAGDYMLLTDGISRVERSWFKNKGILVSVKPLVVPLKKWVNTYGCVEFPPIVAHRFHLFSSEFKKWNLLVYLDLDIIIKRPILDLVHSTNVMGFKDLGSERLKSQLHSNAAVLNKDKFESLSQKYDLESFVINSGVLVIPTSLLSDSSYNDLMKLFYSYVSLIRYPDQGVINLFFLNRISFLSYEYNAFFWFIRSTRVLKKYARIIHFPSSIKPWISTSKVYNEWKSYELLFDKTDFTKPIILTDTWTLSKKYLSFLFMLNNIRFFFFRNNMLDHFLGQVGLKLKKYAPRVYVLLKKVF